jgi:hypothetical protein
MNTNTITFPKTSSKLVWDCHQSLIQLAKHNRVQLIWVPGHEDIVGNKTTDQLARTGSEHPFTGPEPACGISIGVAKKVVRDWTNRNHKKHWESRPIKMGGRTIYWTLPPKRTLFQTCERCLEEDESATHILRLCGHSSFKISSPWPVLCGTKWLLWCSHKVLHFIRSAGLIKG